MIIHWHNLPMDAVEPTSLQGFQGTTGQGVKMMFLSHKGLGKMIFRGPFQPGLFYDSMLLPTNMY